MCFLIADPHLPSPARYLAGSGRYSHLAAPLAMFPSLTLSRKASSLTTSMTEHHVSVYLLRFFDLFTDTSDRNRQPSQTWLTSSEYTLARLLHRLKAFAPLVQVSSTYLPKYATRSTDIYSLRAKLLYNFSYVTMVAVTLL